MLSAPGKSEYRRPPTRGNLRKKGENIGFIKPRRKNQLWTKKLSFPGGGESAVGGLSLLHGVTAEYTCRGSSRGRIVLMVDHTDPRAHLRGLAADPTPLSIKCAKPLRVGTHSHLRMWLSATAGGALGVPRVNLCIVAAELSG